VSRRWLPAFLALAFPGAGHLYAGYPLRALGVAVVTAGLLLPGALYIWTLPVLPISSAAPLRSVGALAVLALPALDAARLATRRSESSAERARFAAAGVALPFAVFALLALDFSLVTSRWLAPMRLDRESGRPNLLPGDLLLVDVRPDLLHRIAPGDLVVFEHPPTSGRLHVKRLVATEGQEISVREGELFVDSEARGVTREGVEPELREEQLGTRRYVVQPGRADQPGFGPLRVPTGTFFALGDDRAVSRDSRAFGPLPVDLLRGRPLRVLWSIDPATGQLRWERIGHDPATRPPS